MPEHKDWLVFAERDLKAATILIYSQEPILPIALYLTQQCAEKSLKAFLVFKKIAPDKIHDLTRLINQCTKIDQEFNRLLTCALELHPYVSGTRYPDSFLPMMDLSLAMSAIRSATNILEFVKDKTL